MYMNLVSLIRGKELVEGDMLQPARFCKIDGIFFKKVITIQKIYQTLIHFQEVGFEDDGKFIILSFDLTQAVEQLKRPELLLLFLVIDLLKRNKNFLEYYYNVISCKIHT